MKKIVWEGCGENLDWWENQLISLNIFSREC
jgi:hypothetical protein